MNPCIQNMLLRKRQISHFCNDLIAFCCYLFFVLAVVGTGCVVVPKPLPHSLLHHLGVDPSPFFT